LVFRLNGQSIVVNFVAAATPVFTLAEPFQSATIEPAQPPGKEIPMDARQHSMNNLFAQLGPPSDSDGIDDFITAHRLLGNGIAPLSRASLGSVPKSLPQRRDHRGRGLGWCNR